MKTLTRVLVVLAVIVITLIGSVPALAANPPPARERYIIHFKPGVSTTEMTRGRDRLGARFEGRSPTCGPTSSASPPAKCARSSSDPEGVIASIEPDYEVRVEQTPNDPDFSQQWGMAKIQAPQAWDVTRGSSSVKVAIVDTGIKLNHPDLAAKIVAARNFTTSSTVDDVYGHGTHVAGIAAAVTNNGLGVAGVGYNASLMSVKVLGDTGSGYHSDIANGIIWATDNGANVINMSLGGPSSSTTLQQAVDYAWSHGVVVVAAAGNGGNSVPSYPGAYANVIGVAATDPNDRLYSFSTYGDWVDVAAPGNALSTTKDGGLRVHVRHLNGLTPRRGTRGTGMVSGRGCQWRRQAE